MPIANYRTEVPVARSISEISGLLVKHGASSITVDYEKETPIGMFFIFETPSGKLPFQVPARIYNVQQVMERDQLQGRNKAGQPARVAWRILRDWIRAQIAIVETQMVQFEEVFLPYLMIDSKNTLFVQMKDKGYLLTSGEHGDR